MVSDMSGWPRRRLGVSLEGLATRLPDSRQYPRFPGATAAKARHTPPKTPPILTIKGKERTVMVY